MRTEDIDEYVTTRVPPEHQGIVRMLRELMRESAPTAREEISAGSLAWRTRKIIAITSRSKTHVTFAFSRGAEFADSHGLLEGTGKTTRHVKIKPQDTVNTDALRDYIGQALKLDQQ